MAANSTVHGIHPLSLACLPGGGGRAGGGGAEVLRSRLQMYTQLGMQLKKLYTDSTNRAMAHKAT